MHFNDKYYFGAGTTCVNGLGYRRYCCSCLYLDRYHSPHNTNGRHVDAYHSNEQQNMHSHANSGMDSGRGSSWSTEIAASRDCAVVMTSLPDRTRRHTSSHSPGKVKRPSSKDKNKQSLLDTDMVSCEHLDDRRLHSGEPDAHRHILAQQMSGVGTKRNVQHERAFRHGHYLIVVQTVVIISYPAGQVTRQHIAGATRKRWIHLSLPASVSANTRQQHPLPPPHRTAHPPPLGPPAMLSAVIICHTY